MIRTSAEEVKNIIHTLGVRKNDNILLHSALFRFGVRSFSDTDLLDILLDSVGPNGTLIIPTFTYSFRRNQVYDVNNSMPDKKLGIIAPLALGLAEYRNECPLFSFCGFGKNVKRILSLKSEYCFGRDSVFASLVDVHCKVLSLGVDYSSGISIFMHFEKQAAVSYREDLVLSGDIIDATGVRQSRRAIHFARDEKRYPNAYTDRAAMGAILKSQGASMELSYKGVGCKLIDSKQACSLVVEKLRHDENFMLREA